MIYVFIMVFYNTMMKMTIHPHDNAEPPIENNGKSKKTKTSSKNSAGQKNRTKLVDEDPYTFMARRLNQSTPLERKFAAAYVDNVGVIEAHNQEDYAIRIACDIGIEHYNAKRWSRAALKEPCVQRMINNRAKNQALAAGATKERLLAEYAKIAFSDIGDILAIKEGRVQIKDFDEMDDDARSILSSVSETKTKFGVNIKVEKHDKMKALEILMRHHGLLEPEQSNMSPEEIALTALQAAKAMDKMFGGEGD